MSLLLDAFCQTDGRRGAYEAAEMTTYAFSADNSRLARFLVESNCLVTAILTRNVPEFVQQPGTSCAALLHNLGSYPAQLRQHCCTSYAAMLHKFGNNAAKVWQQCCARAKVCLLEGWSMRLRVQKDASESVKACI